MKSFLITSSDDFYPTNGTGDWVALHADRGEAVIAFEATMKAHADYMGTNFFLIEIDPATETWNTIRTERKSPEREDN